LKRLLLTALLGAAVVTTTPALAAGKESHLNRILSSGVLRVGTTGDFNPMSFRDPGSKDYKGHQIDIAKRLAEDMGVKVEFVPTDWKTLISGITANKYDVVMTGTSMTVSRAKAVGYTLPWGRTGYMPLTQKKNAGRFKTWEDLNDPNVTVAYNLGTSFEEFVKRELPKAKVKRVESPARDWQELVAGRVDVTISSILEASVLAQKHKNLVPLFGDDVRNSVPLGFLVAQDDQVWLNFMNNWVMMKTSLGYFKSVNEKWGIAGQD
jgi:cyclohexadienyl dehydratase